jgi:hypothetical protein
MTTIEQLIDAIEKAYDVFKKYVQENTIDVFSMTEQDQMLNEVFQELLQLASGDEEDSDYEPGPVDLS